MLTKDDLRAIEKIVDNKLDIKLDGKLKPIHDDIKVIKKDVGTLKQNVAVLQKDMTIMKKDVKKLQKDVGGVINMADKGLLNVQKRVITIEKTLKIPSPDFI